MPTKGRARWQRRLSWARGHPGLILLALIGWLGILARAQCPPAWVVAGLAGTNGAVNVAT